MARNNSDSKLTHLLKCSKKLGIPDMRAAIEKMLVIDYLIGNTDRHQGNFGFLRTSDSLQWLGMAPIFDSGTSLWHDSRVGDFKLRSRPFRSNHIQQ